MLRVVVHSSSKKIRRFPWSAIQSSSTLPLQQRRQQAMMLDQSPMPRFSTFLDPQYNSSSYDDRNHNSNMAGPQQTPVRLDDIEYGLRKREAIRSFLVSMHQTTTDKVIIHTTKNSNSNPPNSSTATTTSPYNIHPKKYVNLERRNYRLGTTTPTVSSPSAAPSVLATWAEEEEVEVDGDDNDGIGDDSLYNDNRIVDFEPSNELGIHQSTSTTTMMTTSSLPESDESISESYNLVNPVDVGPIPEFSITANESTDEYQTQKKVKDMETTTKQEQQINESNNKQQYLVQNRIAKAIKDKDVKYAMELFQTARKSNVDISLKVATDLFFRISDVNPAKAYEVFSYCTNHPDFKGKNYEYAMYRRMCKSLRLLDPTKYYQTPSVKFVEELLARLDSNDDIEMKRQCYPKLVNSLASQKIVTIGKYADIIYQYMVDNDFPMTPGWLSTLLSFSKYNRQGDLPFHDILARLVVAEKVPYPPVALKVVQNMFPYNDSEATKIALQSILKFHDSQEQNDDRSMPPYHVCLGTLEAMSASAARAGDSELILTVWDAIDTFNHKPSEAIYENTIVAFAGSSQTLLNVFSAIDSMLADGFRPSRALIRSVSYLLRTKRSQLYFARNVLSNPDQYGIRASVESLNVVLSAYAERGDVNHALSTFFSFEMSGLKPNADSYSFAMEVLGKDIHRRRIEDKLRSREATVTQMHLDRSLDAADEILTRMEAQGMKPTADLVRNYIELLCLSGEIGTATSVVSDLLQSDQKATVSNKTIYRVAIANADGGNFETARELASALTEPVRSLHSAIRSREQRHGHLKEIRRREHSEQAED